MIKQIIFLIVLTFSIIHIPSQVTAQSSYPEVLESKVPFQNVFYQFNETQSNMTIQRTFTIEQFSVLTFADVLIEQSGNLVDQITIKVQLNGVNATNDHQESNLFDQENILFILDDQAMILPKTTNILTFYVTVTFKQKAIWQFNQHQHYQLRFDAITIKTAYRQQIDVTNQQLNQSNSHFTALIIDPTYNLATQGVLVGNTTNVGSLFAYEMPFYLIMPKNIKSSYYLNLTFSFNLGFSIRAIFLDQFGLATSNSIENGMSYTFRYISHKEVPLVKGLLKFNPKTAGIYNVSVKGNFFITNSYKLFPGSQEMDLFLFINASIIVPLLVLAKLIYRRLFY